MNIQTPHCRIPAIGAFLMLAASLVSGCSAMAARPGSSAAAPVPAQQTLARGDAALQSGKPDKALMEYVSALQTEPDSAEIRYRIGLAHEARGDQAAARQAFSDAVRLDPTHAGACEGLGLALIRTQQHKEARDYLQRALAKDSKHWRAHNGLGILDDLARKPNEAAAHYQAALQMQPEHPVLLNNFGYSRYLAGDYADAQSWFERALTRDKDNATAWSNLALVRVRQGNPAAGVAAFSEFMDAHRAYNNVGYLLYKKGDYAGARQYLEKAITLSPAYYGVAKENLARVEAAQR
jgi:Flp pilus assembly protein TadD